MEDVLKKNLVPNTSGLDAKGRYSQLQNRFFEESSKHHDAVVTSCGRAQAAAIRVCAAADTAAKKAIAPAISQPVPEVIGRVTTAELDALAREAQESHEKEKAAESARAANALRRRAADTALSDFKAAMLDLSNFIAQNPPHAAAWVPKNRIATATATLIRFGEKLREGGYLPVLSGDFSEHWLKNRWQEQLNALNGRITLQFAWKLLRLAWGQGPANEVEQQLSRTVTDDSLMPVRLWLEILATVILERGGRNTEKSQPEPTETGIATASQPLVHAPNAKVPKLVRKGDKETEARDKWLYERARKGKQTYRQIMLELQRTGPKKGWRILRSPQAVEQAVDRFIQRHKLPALPPRKDG